MENRIGVWFPTIRTGTGTDVFTIRLASALEAKGIRTQIAWLPHRAEYLPWSVPAPEPPDWATVVHVNSWMHERFIPCHLPVVVTLHHCVHDAGFSQYKSLAQRCYHRLWIWRREVAAICRADAITAVSYYTKRQFEKIFHLHDILPIYNWIDTEVFASGEARAHHSPFRLLFAGSLSKRKGVDLLGKIMRNLGPDYQLLLTCDPSELAKHPSFPTNIISLGRVNTEAELADIYRNSDALMFPTRLEGFGLVALEALACGVPVIATRGSALPEIVEHGVSGLLCPQDDVEAFADAARELFTNIDRWSKMCHAASIRAKEKFSENQAVNAYMQIYQALSR